MKVLLFIHSLGGGGAERVMATLANHWRGQGREIVLVTLARQDGDRYPLDSSIRRVGLELAGDSAGLLSALTGNLRRVQVLRRMLRSEQPAVALAMLTPCNVLLALAGIGLRGIVLVGSERVHPPLMPLGRAWRLLRAWAYVALDAVVVQTTESAAWMRRHTHARSVVVIPNAVTWPLPVAAPHRSPSEWGTPRRCRLLAVGRLGAQKRFDRLITTFARLVPDFPDWELVILGEGPDRPALERQVEDAGLRGLVMLPGHVGNLGDWYEDADLFAMTSDFEGFPNALAEAMAYGLPVVSTDCDTGPRDLVRHDVDGLLVPTGDDLGLAEALARLMGDPRERARLAGRATEVRERFAMRRIDTLWDHLLADVAP